MSETPRTWTLEGDVVSVLDALGRNAPHEPITKVSGPFVDVGQKFEVVEKSHVDTERERMLTLIRALADALETTEDVQDPLADAADEALLAEADLILARHGIER